jgi:carbamoyl-phosphate synthase small subunit
MNHASLVLDDGTVFAGRWFGSAPLPVGALARADAGADEPPSAPRAGEGKLAAGEVVFNTGMCGYHETLTDPSYYGQIVVMTYPHIGNYGTDEDWTEYGSGGDEVMGRLRASGLVVRSLYEGPIPAGRASLPEFLARYRTTGLTDVDTRALTLRIRNGGSPRGVIVRSDEDGPLSQAAAAEAVRFLGEFPEMEGRNLVSELSLERVVDVDSGAAAGPRVALVDCGVKAGIVRELTAIGCRVSLVPNEASAHDLLAAKPDAVLYSNGPGDPAVLDHLIHQVRALLGKLPVWGICLGHQLVALALGAKTFKMKFGHHGVNNPVRDETTGAILITSQNHGFAVDESTLPRGAEVWFRNANDRTNEGITVPGQKVMAVQFHPEAAPGPRDSLWIFRKFLETL